MSTLKTKRILVTGGAGYIGSHTCKALHQAGFEPVTLDNLVYGHRWAVRWGPFVKGDLADRDLLARIMREYTIEAVIHFAAYAYVGESMTHPDKYFQNNVVNTLNLLDAMNATGVKTIVFSSTCATYGIPEVLPIKETTPQRPINPYGETKLTNERCLHWYDVAFETRSVSLRYFNAAGADLDGEIGEAHEPETHLVPLVIDAAMGKRESVKVFGSDYDTVDGTATRDYIHVSDLASAHVAALRYLRNGGVTTTCNLGTGTGYSVRQVIAAVEHASGRTVSAINAPRRAGDPAVLVADPTRAREILGWQAEHSDIDTIVRSALQWHTRSASGIINPEHILAVV